MRRALLFLPLLLACRENMSSALPEERPTISRALSGVVLDYVLGQPVAAILVWVGDSLVRTDSAGRFLVSHPVGRITLAVDDIRYEPLQVPIEHSRNKDVFLTIRGYSPYVLQCDFGQDSVTATIIDLQGRKTVNRRDQSTLVGRTGGTTVHSGGNSWRWHPVDGLTWFTTVPFSGATPDTVDWRVEDADGFVLPTRCVNPSSRLRALFPPLATHPQSRRG